MGKEEVGLEESFRNIFLCHHIHSLQPGNSGDGAVWPHAVDQREVSYIEGAVWGSSEA